MSIQSLLSDLFKSREEFELTSGGIARPLFYLSLPIVVMNLFQTAYNLADTFWLGQYSTNALAAISFAFPIVFLLISLALGLSVAGSVLVAQHTGASQKRRAEYAASQTVAFAVIVSVILGGLGYVFVDEFLALLGAAPSVASLATGYMRVISLGVPFIFGFSMFISLMRGYGDTITPMFVMFGSVVLNIVLDPILIFGFENNPLFGYLSAHGLETWLFDLTGYTGSGIEGAAIATVAARVFALVIGFAIMFQGHRGIQIRLSQMVPDLSFARKMINIGLPASIEGTARALSINLLMFIIAAFPETIVAAYGIGTRVFSVIFLPALALSQGIETMTGQNVGANKEDRAAKTNHFGSRVMLIGLTVFGVVVWLAAEPIAAVFTTDPAVVEASGTFLRYAAPTFGFIGVMRAYTGGFRGAGKTLIAAVISLASLGAVRVPVAWIATNALSLGATGLWLAFPASNIAGGVLAYLWFKRDTWRETDLTETHSPSLPSETAGDD